MLQVMADNKRKEKNFSHKSWLYMAPTAALFQIMSAIPKKLLIKTFYSFKNLLIYKFIYRYICQFLVYSVVEKSASM